MPDKEKAPYHIVAAIGQPEHLTILLALAAPLARTRQGHVTPLYVGAEETMPAWLRIPEEQQAVVDAPALTHGDNVGQAILDFVRDRKPDLLLMLWRGQASRGRYLLGRTLDPVLQYAPCDVGVVRVTETSAAFAERMTHLEKILVPLGGGPNADFALRLALDLDQQAQVTALRVAQRDLGLAAVTAQWQILTSALEDVPQRERVRPHVSLAGGVVTGIAQEAHEDYDLLFVGATQESLVDRLIFGNLPQQIIAETTLPAIIVRRRDPMAAGALRRARWRLVHILPQLTLDERTGIYGLLRRGVRMQADFSVMMILATGIASLGLLLDSPAVVIGAMLMAPLMLALVGISLGVVQGDSALLRLAIRTTIIGTLIVLGVSAGVGLIVPGRRITQAMLSRSTPSLLDLAIALLSGAAAAYANSRRDVASALPGVAIAVALVPPLATVGLAAVALDGEIALGALLLFATNLAAIIAASTLIFLWMGFRPNIGQRQHARVFRGGVLGTAILLVVITVILGVLTAQTIREGARYDRIARVLEREIPSLGQQVTLREWELGPRSGDILSLNISVEAPQPVPYEDVVGLQRALEVELEQPVSLSVGVMPVTRVNP
jgi:uncharacterized hydrophobic protein (TIGR00271 family)